jgi:hypothetical protein
MEYSHRDRRAHREVARGFALVTATVAGLTLFVLYAPKPLFGFLGVVGLGVVGGGFVVWGERLLADYRHDLLAGAAEPPAGGFARAEVGGVVGLERAVGRPTERSPHARRRTVWEPAAGKGR